MPSLLEPVFVSVPGDDVADLDERLDAGIPSHTILTAKGGIVYRTLGEGRPVVLVHAVPLSSLAWVSVLPHLAAMGLRVYAMDMPGCGGTPPAPAPLSVGGYAEYVEAFMDALALDQPSAIGHASHAATVLHLSATRPERVKRLVLSKLPYVDEAGRARMAAAKPTWYRDDGAMPMREDAPWNPVPSVTPQRFRVMTMRMNFDMYRSGPRSAEGHHALAPYDFLGDLGRLSTPTRFVWGERDHFAEHQALVVGSAAQVSPELHLVKDASAWPMYERPRAWALATGGWLAAG